MSKHSPSCELHLGDCLEIMDSLIERGVKIDAIIADPPYGITSCKWDSVILFEELWPRLKALRKEKTPVVLFGSEPFSSALRMSNIKEFKYDWIWEKEQGANFMSVKYHPYKVHEIVSVFYRHHYYPQMTVGAPYISGKGDSGEITDSVKKVQTVNTGTRYPRSVQRFSTDKSKGSFHPTQKPVDFLEYLVRTYSNEGDTILDFSMGSGSTGVASLQLNRNFIGIEIEEKYFNTATKRIAEVGGIND